jgi:hypothetical protein
MDELLDMISISQLGDNDSMKVSNTNNDNDKDEEDSRMTATRSKSWDHLASIVTASLFVSSSLVPDDHHHYHVRLMPLLETFFTAALIHHITTSTSFNNINDDDDANENDGIDESFVEKEDDRKLLYSLFGHSRGRNEMDPTTTATIPSSNTRNYRTKNHPPDEFVLFYHNVRRLGWLPQPNINTVHSDGAQHHPKYCDPGTYLLQDALFRHAVQHIIIKKVRSMILGNYDDDTGSGMNHNHADDNIIHDHSFKCQSIIEWTDRMIIPWLLLEVFGIDRTVNHDMDHHHPFLKGVHDYVHMMVVQTYWSTRLSEIFDIITSYPDSLPAILDLKYVFHLYAQQMSRRSNNRCTTTTTTTTTAAEAAKEGKQAPRLPPQDLYQCYEQLLQELSSSLRYTFMVRLNHPGANTTQMIDVYIAAIQVLRILLQNSNQHTTEWSSPFSMSTKRINTVIAYITEPVRSYLRHYRNDTVRCILTNLTNTDSGGSGNINAANPTMSSNTDSTTSNHVLYHELRRQDTKPLEYMTMDSDDEDDDEEECPTMDWQPRPSIYTHNASRHPKNRGNQYHRSGSANTKNDSDSDILAMLVSIYGSKELFVNEYRSMLADKLLGRNYDNNTDQDIHTLELLKLRLKILKIVPGLTKIFVIPILPKRNQLQHHPPILL